MMITAINILISSGGNIEIVSIISFL